MQIDADQLVVVGRILRGHGVRGELKVLPHVDSPDLFREWAHLQVGVDAAGAGLFDIEVVRHQTTKKGPLLILKLRGIDSRDDADALKGFAVFVERSRLPAPDVGGEDLIGLVARDEAGVQLGVVVDYVRLPAQSLIAIRMEDGREVLIPHVPELVPLADPAGKSVVIRPIEGLLD